MYSPNTAEQRPVRIGLGVLAAAAAVALLYYGRVFFITVIVATMIAFLLEPLVVLFQRLRMPRGVASFVVCVIALMTVYLAGLGLYTQGQALADDLPAYGARLNELVDDAALRLERFQEGVLRIVVPRRLQDPGALPPENPEPASAARNTKKKRTDPAPPPAIQEVRVRPEPRPLAGYVYDYLTSFYNVLLMASFVPFLVYFMLSWRDLLRERLLNMLEGDARFTVAKALDGVGGMIRAYVIGNFLLGVLLTIASGILFASVGLPYWLVVAPLSGFLSLAPYIGLPLALIPPMVAALPEPRAATLYLFLFVSVSLLHLLTQNLLYPKFVGARVHLNPLVVTIALMFWGTLWGGIGLLLAIPITAAVKAVCDNLADLETYGRLLGD